MRSTPERSAVLLLWTLIGVAPAAWAGSVAGVCPDGSAFIVQRRASAPCENPRFANDPSELPPLRPEMLPHPYTWQVDQEARNPNNPYKLLEAAEKIRRARAAQQAGVGEPKPAPAPTLRQQDPEAPSQRYSGSPMLALSEDELFDLVRLVALRQAEAPAEILVENVQGEESLRIQVATSSSFEALVLGALGVGATENRVLVFTASAAVVDAEFHPNFFVTQGGKTFRPDPQDSKEVAYLVGEAGTIPAGALALGYIVVPAHFDPSRPMTLWWNDRSTDVVLLP